MQSRQKTQKGENKFSFPERTIQFLAATGAQAPTRPPAAKVIRLKTANQKQIDVTLTGAGFRRKADRRICKGASVLLNQSTT
jgi:hypothetical protein